MTCDHLELVRFMLDAATISLRLKCKLSDDFHLGLQRLLTEVPTGDRMVAFCRVADDIRSHAKSILKRKGGLQLKNAGQKGSAYSVVYPWSLGIIKRTGTQRDFGSA